MNPRLLPAARLARAVLRSQSDERLVALAAAGSEAAFEAIVARHRRALLVHCARILGPTDAEEAVQDAFVRAHGALRKGSVIRDIDAWLHVIAHNAALNVLRARAQRQESSPAGLEQRPCPAPRPDQREHLQDVVAAVQALPRRQRHAIVMRELEGRSYDEIAARLGTSNGAVRQLLHRARAALRGRLGALTGVEPLIRWVGAGGGSSAAQIGAVSGGCAVAAKICSVAVLPALVISGPSPRGHHATIQRAPAIHRVSRAPRPVPRAQPVPGVDRVLSVRSTPTRPAAPAAPAAPVSRHASASGRARAIATAPAVIEPPAMVSRHETPPARPVPGTPTRPIGTSTPHAATPTLPGSAPAQIQPPQQPPVLGLEPPPAERSAQT